MLVVSAPASGHAAETRDEAPYEALLPAAEPHLLPAASWFHATQVLDDETGLPIQGASMRAYDEDTRPQRIEYAPLLGEATSNSDGIATVVGPEARAADHWVVSARGYAPGYAFGYHPPRVVRLRRGVAPRVQVTDFAGAPVAGLALSVFLGCPHGPVAARMTTDDDGWVQFPPLDPDTMHTVWHTSRAGRCSRWQVGHLAEQAAAGRALRLWPARTAQGVVLDARGAPLAGVVVREGPLKAPSPFDTPSFYRGPATRTDAAGRFTLHGLPPLGEAAIGLLIVRADGRVSHRVVPSVAAPTMRIELDDDHAEEDETELGSGSDSEATLPGVVRLWPRDASGGRLPRLPRLVAVREDGTLVDRLPVTPGSEVTLAPGRWRFEPASAFALLQAVPFEIDVMPGGRSERDILVTHHARAAFAGATRPLPSLGALSLLARHEVASVLTSNLAEGRVFVPEEGSLVLSSQDVDASFADAIQGVRRVRAERAQQRRLHLVAPSPVASAQLHYDNHVEDLWIEDHAEDVLVFSCLREALLTLTLEDESRWRVAVPAGPRGETREIRLDGARHRVQASQPMRLAWASATGEAVPPAHLRVEALDGSSEDVEVLEAESPEGDLFSPCRVTWRASGYQVVVRDVARAESHKIDLGPGVLRVVARDPQGKRVASVVMVDGHLHDDAGEGPFELRGLWPGLRRVVVTPVDPALRGRSARVQVSDASVTWHVMFTKR